MHHFGVCHNTVVLAQRPGWLLCSCPEFFLGTRERSHQVCIAEKNTMTKTALAGMGLLHTVRQGDSLRLRGVKAGAQAGIDAGTLKQRCFQALPTQPRPTCLGMVPPTVAWALPHQPVIKKMPSRTCPQASLMEAVPHLSFLLPRCVNLQNGRP